MNIHLKDTELVLDELGEKETIIFLHGLGANRKIWTDIPGSLAKKFHILNVDMRGFGESGNKEVPNISFAAWKDDLRFIIDRHTFKQVHLIGHSLGSFIALAVAAEMSEKIKSIVAISCFKSFSAKVSEMFRERAKLVMAEGVSPKMIESAISVGFHQNSISRIPDKIMDYKAILSANLAQNYANALLSVDRLSIESALAKIKCPVMVISGKGDQVIPPHESKEVQENITGAQWVLIEDAGHQVHFEQSEHVANEINKFLSGH